MAIAHHQKCVLQALISLYQVDERRGVRKRPLESAKGYDSCLRDGVSGVHSHVMAVLVTMCEMR